MTMFGGYGKPFGLLAAAGILPLYGGMFIGMAFPDYYFHFFLGGFVMMVVDEFAVLWYSATHFRNIRKLAVDMQYKDGTQDFWPILYEKAPLVLQTPVTKYGYTFPEGRKAFSITDLDGDEWLLDLDHPLMDLVPSMEDTPVGAFVTSLFTQKLAAMPCWYVEVPLHASEVPKLSWVSRRILRKKPKDRKEVRVIYGHATAAKVKAAFDMYEKEGLTGQALIDEVTRSVGDVKVPDPREIISVYDAWYDMTHGETITEKEQFKAHTEKLQDMLDNHLPITLETAPSRINERSAINLMPYLKWAAVGLGVTVLPYLLMHAMGWV